MVGKRFPFGLVVLDGVGILLLSLGMLLLFNEGGFAGLPQEVAFGLLGVGGIVMALAAAGFVRHFQQRKAALAADAEKSAPSPQPTPPGSVYPGGEV